MHQYNCLLLNNRSLHAVGLCAGMPPATPDLWQSGNPILSLAVCLGPKAHAHPSPNPSTYHPTMVERIKSKYPVACLWVYMWGKFPFGLSVFGPVCLTRIAGLREVRCWNWSNWLKRCCLCTPMGGTWLN